jgi:hypothetical protein
MTMQPDIDASPAVSYDPCALFGEIERLASVDPHAARRLLDALGTSWWDVCPEDLFYTACKAHEQADIAAGGLVYQPPE